MKQTIAFFDFDGTLTSGDSLLPFLHRLKGTRRFVLDLFLASPWLAGFALRVIPNHHAKLRLLKVSLAGRSKQELYRSGEEFVRAFSERGLKANMIDRLRFHQSVGHKTVLVSASLDVYLERWAEQMGFDYCLCSRVAVDEHGNATGALEGDNCYGDEKVTRIKTLLESTGMSSIYCYAYGDTKGDLPMLRFVDEGYWVTRTGFSRV